MLNTRRSTGWLGGHTSGPQGLLCESQCFLHAWKLREPSEAIDLKGFCDLDVAGDMPLPAPIPAPLWGVSLEPADGDRGRQSASEVTHTAPGTSRVCHAHRTRSWEANTPVSVWEMRLSGRGAVRGPAESTRQEGDSRKGGT